MPRGDKSSYTDKQKRQAAHIEDSEKAQGRSDESAERIAWATVNKQDGGGKKASVKKAPAKKTTAKKTAAEKASPAKKAAKKTAGS